VHFVFASPLALARAVWLLCMFRGAPALSCHKKAPEPAICPPFHVLCLCPAFPPGAVVVFDLRTKLFKWQQHLDLTTTTTKFTAHMFSSPTLVDLDADGKMEIIVGTSVGFVYVLDHKVRGWQGRAGEGQSIHPCTDGVRHCLAPHPFGQGLFRSLLRLNGQ
jgi:hypothetical protein